MIHKEVAQLEAAINQQKQALVCLENSGWKIGVSAEMVGLFRNLKNGKPRKTPSFYLFFNRENTLSKWSVCHEQGGRLVRSFAVSTDALEVLIAMAVAFGEGDVESARLVLLGKHGATTSVQQVNKLADRGVDELIGLCKGILFGGFVVYEQAEGLWKWLEANPLVKSAFVGRELFGLLSGMVGKGALSLDDEAALLGFFSSLGGSVEVLDAGHNPSSALPLNNPAPVVIVSGSLFVLTGNFRLGSRAVVMDFIESIGGRVSAKTVLVDTNYLVLGDVGSDSWVHSTHGRKIERAVELRNARYPVAIISEAHFMKAGAVLIEIARRRLFR